MATSDAVPVIDLSPLLIGGKIEGVAIHEGATRIGFFYVCSGRAPRADHLWRAYRGAQSQKL